MIWAKGGHSMPHLTISRVRVSLAFTLAALVCAACGAGGGATVREATATPPAVGWAGEVDDAPYVAYERVTLERLPRARMEQVGEVRLTQQVRRLPAYRLRDGGASAIRFTDDDGRGWLAWQPSVVLRARRDFAQQESSQPSQISTLAVIRVDWPNACLGITRPGVNCAETVTPGFKITLRLGAVTAVFHSDLRDKVQRAQG
jgi:hypothetical protein